MLAAPQHRQSLGLLADDDTMDKHYAQTLNDRLSLHSPAAMSQERSRQGAVAAQVVTTVFELRAQQPCHLLCVRLRELKS